MDWGVEYYAQLWVSTQLNFIFGYSCNLILHPKILAGFDDFGGCGIFADKRYLLAVSAFELSTAAACQKAFA